MSRARTERLFAWAGGVRVAAAGLALLALAAASCEKPEPPAEKVALPAHGETAQQASLAIQYPLDGTVFPPEIAAPTFRWETTAGTPDAYQVTVRFQDGGESIDAGVTTGTWTPSDAEWEEMKKRSVAAATTVTVLASQGNSSRQAVAAAEIAIRTSRDEVGAPIFYREVNLPFNEAVKDPSRIRWRFGSIASKERPRIVLEKLPVCGNCHSFSNSGQTLAMEVDSGNDKGAYAIVPVEREMVLDKEKIITWADYRREDEHPTFGLLCQISPDGRYVAGTVKDQALAVYRDSLMFSQLFFLINTDFREALTVTTI